MIEFKISKSYIRQTKLALPIFISVIALVLLLPLLPGEEPANPSAALIATGGVVLLFAFLSIFTWLTLRKLPFADVALDDDGIWCAHTGKKSGLVAWERISKIREKTFLQCLDVLDDNNCRLLRLEYQLEDFEKLRMLLLRKTENTREKSQDRHFSKSRYYHLFYAASVLCYSGLGLFVWSTEKPLLGYGAMIMMSVLVTAILYEYCLTPIAVDIHESHFEVHYPCVSKVIPFSDIEGIYIIDKEGGGSKYPGVRIHSVKSEKPFKLYRLGVDANVLYKALTDALEV